jgi:hypothetical protein
MDTDPISDMDSDREINMDTNTDTDTDTDTNTDTDTDTDTDHRNYREIEYRAGLSAGSESVSTAENNAAVEE